jgi:hypothetical protein
LERFLADHFSPLAVSFQTPRLVPVCLSAIRPGKFSSRHMGGFEQSSPPLSGSKPTPA